MEELIIEYIHDLCQIKGGAIFFDGRKVYYDTLKKHLGDLFNLSELEVDGYMIICFIDMDRDFDYSHFMTCLKPTMPDGRLLYLDYVYDGNIGLAGHPNRRYYAGIDPAIAYGDITIGVSSRGFGELTHPNTVPDGNTCDMARAVAAQTINLELTPLDEDLEE